MSEKVLILGSTGPIGRSVTTTLSLRGFNTVGMSRSTEFKYDAFSETSNQKALSNVRPSIVIYLVRPKASTATGTVGESIDSADALEMTAQYAAENGVTKFIFASSSAVYGTKRATPLSESDELDPENEYAQSKARAETVLRRVGDRTHMETVAARIFNAYGPNCSDSLVNKLGLGIAAVWDTDKFVRDYVHVDDISHAIALLCEFNAPLPSIVNVGSGIGLSNKTLLELAPTSDSVRRVPYHGEISVSIADNALSTRVLGVQYRHSASEFINSL